jgi:hypothetical protein
MSYKIAKCFWTSRKDYPNYPHTEQRRLIDIDFISKHLKGVKSILDLGCADGYLLSAIKGKSIEKFGYDISEKLLEKNCDKDLTLKVCDFTECTEFPKVDLTISMGLFPYIFKYKDLCNILSCVKSNLIVRVPCTLDKEEYINKYSKELGENYSSVYRTVSSYHNIFKNFYRKIDIQRSYPDEIESKYGTKHYYFVCKEIRNVRNIDYR